MDTPKHLIQYFTPVLSPKGDDNSHVGNRKKREHVGLLDGLIHTLGGTLHGVVNTFTGDYDFHDHHHEGNCHSGGYGGSGVGGVLGPQYVGTPVVAGPPVLASAPVVASAPVAAAAPVVASSPVGAAAPVVVGQPRVVASSYAGAGYH